ncbi:MAG: hypothetical protein NVS1B14_04140 [Vulcanimicrobiaceae bacterium]
MTRAELFQLCETQLDRIPNTNLLNRMQRIDIVAWLVRASRGEELRLLRIVGVAVAYAWTSAPQIFFLNKLLCEMEDADNTPGKGCERCAFTGYQVFESDNQSYAKRCDCATRGVATVRLIGEASGDTALPDYAEELVRKVGQRNPARLGPIPNYNDDLSRDDVGILLERFAKDRARDAAKRDRLANVKPASDAEIERIKAEQEANQARIRGTVQ